MYNDFEGNGVDNIDDDSYSYGQSSSTSSSRVLRRKGGTRHSVDTYNSRDLKSDISSDLENNYGVKTAPAIARAVDTLDTWAQLTGRYVCVYFV